MTRCMKSAKESYKPLKFKQCKQLKRKVKEKYFNSLMSAGSELYSMFHFTVDMTSDPHDNVQFVMIAFIQQNLNGVKSSVYFTQKEQTGTQCTFPLLFFK